MGIGTTELLVILLILLLMFGATRLPALGRGLGQGLRSFRDALRGGEENKDAGLQRAAEDEHRARPDDKSHTPPTTERS